MAVEVVDVAAGYRGRRVLEGVTFRPKPGELSAIIGPNGAGKTTLVRTLLGALTPERGAVLLEGRPLGEWVWRERGRRIAYVPQRGTVAFEFSVKQVVGLGAHAFGRGDALTNEALARVGLVAEAERPFSTLSVGQQQRAVLARGLVQAACQRRAGMDPIVLADEPVSAMDPLFADMAMDLLARVAAEGGTVVVVLHDLALVERWCAQVLLLDGSGRAASSGERGEVLTGENLKHVFGVPFVRAEGMGETGKVGTWIAASERDGAGPSTMSA